MAFQNIEISKNQCLDSIRRDKFNGGIKDSDFRGLPTVSPEFLENGQISKISFSNRFPDYFLDFGLQGKLLSAQKAIPIITAEFIRTLPQLFVLAWKVNFFP